MVKMVTEAPGDREEGGLGGGTDGSQEATIAEQAHLPEADCDHGEMEYLTTDIPDEGRMDGRMRDYVNMVSEMGKRDIR